MKARDKIVLLLLCLHCLTLHAEADDELPGAGQTAPVESIAVAEGFHIELLRSAHKGEGSWISVTFDDHGRLILGRDKRGIVRLTLNERHDSVDRFEVLEDTLKHCRGVLYAHESLYVCATDSRGFYRLRDLDGDDHFEEVTLQFRGHCYSNQYE